MTRDNVLWSLREAAEELERTITEMERDSGYSESELSVALTLVYHHLNTSWNARAAPAERVAASSDADVRAWRQFPSDLKLGA